MLKWILLISTAVILVVVWAYLRMRGGTVYIVNDHGFVAHSFSKPVVHQTDREGVSKVTERLLKGDIYDMVWVSGVNDEFTGFMLTLESGNPVADVMFKTLSEGKEILAFKESLHHFGYKLDESADGFNGALDEAHRVTSLDYTLPKDAAKVTEFILAAIEKLQGPNHKTFYLNAMLMANGPVGKSSGVVIAPASDPLSEVLGSK